MWVAQPRIQSALWMRRRYQPRLFACSVYVVVAKALTVRLPFRGTVPIPGDIVTVDAFSTCQVTVAACPTVIEDGVTSNLTMRGKS